MLKSNWVLFCVKWASQSRNGISLIHKRILIKRIFPRIHIQLVNIRCIIGSLLKPKIKDF